jgi:hypothetical protein
MSRNFGCMRCALRLEREPYTWNWNYHANGAESETDNCLTNPFTFVNCVRRVAEVVTRHLFCAIDSPKFT